MAAVMTVRAPALAASSSVGRILGATPRTLQSTNSAVDLGALGSGTVPVDPKDEVKRLSSKVAELSAQAKNEERAVGEMERLSAEVQRLTVKLRQTGIEKRVAEQKASEEAAVAKDAMSQRNVAMKERAAAQLEAERASALASKLTKEMKDLQQQLSEDWLQRTVMQRQIDTYAEEVKHLRGLQEMLDEETRCRQKIEAQLTEEQKLVATLKEEFHARLLGDKDRIASLGEFSFTGQRLTDDESIEAFGEVLKKSMVGKSAAEAQKVKRQLLFCFHPDKNPATDVATRITQILNAATAEASTIRKAAAPTARATPSARASPTVVRRSSSSARFRAEQYGASAERPQSARPSRHPAVVIGSH